MSIKRQGTTIINDQRGLEEISNVTFDTSFTYSAPAQGEVIWNTTNPGLELGLSNGIVSRIGETIVTKAKNNQPSNIGKSALVVVVGHDTDGTPLIESWDFLTKSTKDILGICAQTLTAGATGYVVVKGTVSGVNTTGSDYGETWATGDILYASSASGVSYTNIEPAAPATKTIVAKVAVAHATNGTLEVNIVRSSNLSEDDLVELSSLANGDVLVYNTATSRFENGNVSYSKLTGTVPTWNQNTTGSAATLTTARTLTIGATGKTFNGSTNVSWSLSEIGAAATSHTHDIANVTGLQTSLDAKLAATGGAASGLTLNDGYTEEVFSVSGTTPALSPTNGSIQTWVLAGNSTPTAGSWASGQSIVLHIDDGAAYTVNWTSLGVSWKTGAGAAPLLNASSYTAVVLWKIGSTIYGARVGDA